MIRRWMIFIFVACGVVAADQWTKFLAVRHLTPGIARAHFAAGSFSQPTLDERRQALESLRFGDALSYFYTSVSEPCRSADAYCPTVSVIDGFWAFRYAENRGAAWSLFAKADATLREPFLFVVPLLALALLGWFFWRSNVREPLLIGSLAFIVGGAAGNFIDRVHLGYVVDFIDWYVGDTHWPTFNLADAAITIGVGMLLVRGFGQKRATDVKAEALQVP